ncbi:ABC transporter permease [Methylomonas sp. MS20]|uniref:ABC transporter permease n=1 Tax=unclassified Methylomonas TaxID=2608980 RepID=UPI00143C2099|nr:ABC transporter permease [Methylomonas sp. MV1]MDT4332581.1 ABC transporter permease [Methylomonas sp. MV1]NJA07651.1 ABC transporter permease [Methylococcaceae bacterium WWC4]
MFWRIYAMLVKEFLDLVKDKKSRFVLIAPPIVQLFVFGYAATYDLNQVPIAVYNEDAGIASRELIARFGGAPAFREARRLRREAEVAEVLDTKQVLLVLHIGRHFSRDLLSGRQPADVQILLDGRDSNTAQIAQGYAQTVIADFNIAWARDHGLPLPAAELRTRAWFNPNLESRWFIVPGIVGLLTLVVTMLVTSLSVAREREQGTFDQLLVTPLTPREIVVGKAVPGFLIGVFEATFSIVMVVLWFRVPLLGSLTALYIGIVFYVFAIVGVGLMISSLSTTQQQGLLGGFLVIVPAVILSGYATPIANMPEAVQTLTLLNPLRYFLVIVRGVFLQGLDSPALLHQYWPMALIGLASLTCAGWLFRKRMY